MARKRNKKSLIILASQSPRRRALLKKAGIKFRSIPSGVKEKHNRGLTPARLVCRLALQKALWVAKKYPTHKVLGADTLVFIGSHVIGKPKNKRQAEKILSRLSGSWQRVYTGVAVVWDGGKKRRFRSALSYVKLKKLTNEDIKRACRKHMDKAGAYAVQEKQDPFVERIRGEYDNVVGLPVRLVRRLLRGAA